MALTIRGEKRVGDIRIRSKGGLPIIEETWEYLVTADSVIESNRLDVATLDGLPVVNVSTSTSGLTICRSKSAVRRDENALMWDVTCEFSSEVDEGSQTQDPESDPNVWVPIYETKFERLQEIVTRDVNGTPIANSAGQPFQTGLTISRFIPVWEFYQFEPASVTDEDVIERNETLNDATFKGRAAETLLLTVLTSVVGFYYGSRRRLTKYSLKYNDRTWTHKRLDVGTVYLDTGVLKPYLDNDGNVMLGGLNGSGARVTAGNDPAVLEFDIYPTTTFTSFLRL